MVGEKSSWWDRGRQAGPRPRVVERQGGLVGRRQMEPSTILELPAQRSWDRRLGNTAPHLQGRQEISQPGLLGKGPY